MKNKISSHRQYDFFDISRQRWQKLPEACRRDAESFLTQLFIQATQNQLDTQNKEQNNASEN